MAFPDESLAQGEEVKLHLLGTQAMKEAQRGHEVLEHLAEQIDGMMAEHGSTH